MPAGLIIIEMLFNVAEVILIFYLLFVKFMKKNHAALPTLLFIAGSIVYLSLPLFLSSVYFSPIETTIFISYFIYIVFFSNKGIWKKNFWVSFVYALLFTFIFLTVTITFIRNGFNIDITAASSSSRIGIIIVALSKILLVIAVYILSLNNKINGLTITPSLMVCFTVPLICVIAGIFIQQVLLTDSDYNFPDMIIYIIAGSYLLINIMVFILYEKINNEAEKNYILTAKHKQYEITEQHNSEIVKIYSDMREWRHNYTNHMQLIMTFLEKSKTRDSNIDDAVNYIKNLDDKIKSSSSAISTGNYIVDAIVSAKAVLAYSFNIKFDYNISLPETLTIKDMDLCAMLSNLLDNSIEACQKIETEKNRFIKFKMLIIKNQIYIQVVNSTNGEYRREGDRFRTTKQGQWHGIGMKHIEAITEEYGGIYNIEAETDLFTTQISIPLAKK